MTAPIAEQMATAFYAISNVLGVPDATERLARFGYTAAKLQEGLALHEAAKDARNTQARLQAQSKRATDTAQAACTAAWSAYQRVAKVARAVVKPHDPLLLTDLGLNHAMPRGSSDFMAAANQLFAGIAATPQVAALLAEYGYAAPALAAEQAHITAYRTALHQQQSAMAQSHRATRAQQTALRTLMRWIAQYRLIASVAFSDEPTLLGLLSIQEQLSRPKRKKRGDENNRKDAEDAKNGEVKKAEVESVGSVAEGEERVQAGEDDQAPPIQQQE